MGRVKSLEDKGPGIRSCFPCSRIFCMQLEKSQRTCKSRPAIWAVMQTECPGKRRETFHFIVSLIRNICAFAHTQHVGLH